jgi:peptidoglycan/xylan/chitin deacetylase (PgdA/CDA1 family)
LKVTAAAFGSLLVPGSVSQASPFSGDKEPPRVEPNEFDLRGLARRKRIKLQGVASRAPALEFHGDHYTLAGGAYSMNPDTFGYLMEWFQANDVWAMNLEETVGFFTGTMEMPARSVILTTDSGNTSQASLARMIPVLQQTGMHFISFIWTQNMESEEHDICAGNSCWDAFLQAKESGVFTFGTHTESHRDFAQLTPEQGIRDLLQSKQEIEDNLGINIDLIAWPFESYPSWARQLEDYGFVGGLAGNCRPSIQQNVVLYNDPLRWSLPRVLPPNPGTLRSRRPRDLTIEQMMVMYSDGFE